MDVMVVKIGTDVVVTLSLYGMAFYTGSYKLLRNY